MFHGRTWRKPAMTMLLLLALPGTSLGENSTEAALLADNDIPYQFSPVMVTAEKRAEDAQNVPISMSVLSDKEIEDAGITSVREALQYMPNLNFIDYGASFEQRIYMRGLGSTHNSPAVNFNIDGVTQFKSESLDMALYDIESIEVLRGPQGTLYGRNSLGGVVNIKTRKPDNTVRGKVSADVGTYNYQQYQAMGSAPLVEDNLFIGIAGAYGRRDGYTWNHYLNDDVDNLESVDGRLHLRWTPTADFEANMIMYAEHDNHGTSALQPLDQVKDRPHRADFDHLSDSQRQVLGGSINLEWQFDSGTLTSISSVQNLQLDADSDYDYSIYDMNTFLHRGNSWQYAEEIRYSGGKKSDMLKWTAGAYFWGSEEDDVSITTDGKDMPLMWGYPGNNNHNKAEMTGYGFAPFGQATLTLFEKLDLTAGLRWEWEKNSGQFDDYTNYVNTDSTVQNLDKNKTVISRQWLPKFSAAYRFTEEFMSYASVAWGYRSGGFNFMYDPNSPDSVSFEPEKSINYEVGVKTKWLDNRLYANASLFYIDIEDMQVSVGIPGKMTMMVDNAAKARSQGAELEVGVRPITGLDISATYGFVDMKYKEYKDPVRGVDYSDNRPPYVPRHTYSVAAQYRHPLTEKYNFFVRGELIGTGKQYWASDNKESQAAYQIVNARVGVESESFDVYLWAKNLLNEEYVKVGYQTGSGVVYAQSGDPSVFGANIVYKF